MIEVKYTPSFVRQAKSLEEATFKELEKKIASFKNPKNHTSLRVHKLKGRLKDFYAFSVTHRTRVIFEYVTENEAWFHHVGGHEVYE